MTIIDEALFKYLFDVNIQNVRWRNFESTQFSARVTIKAFF
jgi:hypothetical protein